MITTVVSAVYRSKVCHTGYNIDPHQVHTNIMGDTPCIYSLLSLPEITSHHLDLVIIYIKTCPHTCTQDHAT